MGISPVVYVTLETDLTSSGLSGGLGILATDTFHEARRRQFPFYLFSPLYPRRLHQYSDGNTVKSEFIEVETNPLRRVDSFRIDTAWYPTEATIYLHPESTESTRAYFVHLRSVNGSNNQWLDNMSVYNEQDEGQQLFLRYAFSKAMTRFIKKNGINPRLFHLNESDAAFSFLTIEEEGIDRKTDGTRYKFIGHTHTPEAHGHKSYSAGMIGSLLCDSVVGRLKPYQEDGFIRIGKLLATESAVLCCVSDLHQDVTKRTIYSDLADSIVSVTNGVDINWINQDLQDLFDSHVTGWRENPDLLPEIKVTDTEFLRIYDKNRHSLARVFGRWRRSSEVISNFDEEDVRNSAIVTFAKRLTEYKRPDKLLDAIQQFPDATFLFAGRPVGEWGYSFLGRLIRVIKDSGARIAYVLNYNREKSRALVAGSKIWINVPESHREASGTSWEKVLANGRLLISTQSGSVPEVVVDGENGFLVKDDLTNLTEKLGNAMALEGRNHARMIGNAVLSSPYVLTHRMFDEYVNLLYAEVAV